MNSSVTNVRKLRIESATFEEELKDAFDKCPSIKDTVWLKDGNITLYEVAIHLHNKYSLDKQRVAEAIKRLRIRECDCADSGHMDSWCEWCQSIDEFEKELGIVTNVPSVQASPEHISEGEGK